MRKRPSRRNPIPPASPAALRTEVQELRRRLRRTQRELRAVRARYRLLYERGPAANFVVGRDGTVLDVDEKSARSLGYARERLIGRPALELVPPRRRKALAGALKRAFGGEPTGRLEVELLGRRGPRRFLLPEGYLPLKENGRVGAVLGSGIDITDWRGSHRQDQRRFEERLTALHGVVNELSTAGTFEELCRQAIELGRKRLGFDRLGLWFLTDEPNVVRGSFGTDHRGRVRDISGVAGPVDPDSLMGRTLNDRIRLGVAENERLRNAEGEVVGHGTLMIASLWDGEKIIGCLCADNLLRGEPFSPQQCELLGLYASALGYSCSRKRAEEALRRSEEHFRTFFEASPIGIEVYDGQGRLTDANRACLDLFGVSDISEVMGFDLFADPNLTDDVKGRLSRGQTVRFERPFDFEKVHAHKLYRTSRRGIMWTDVLITPLRSAEGETRGYLLTVQDITERKRAEEHLRLYRMAVEGSQDLIAAVNREYKYLLANEAFLRRHAVSRKELEGRSVAEVLGEEFFTKVLKPHVERCLRGQTVRFEAPFPPGRGSEGWFEVLYYPLPGEDKEPAGLVAVIRDITERKRAEEAMRGLHLKLLNAREAERKRLAAELHDAVGQGLVALQLSLRAVQEQCPRGEGPACGDMLGAVLRQCDELVREVRRVCRGIFPSALEALGLAGALRQLAQEFRSRCAIRLRCYGSMQQRRLRGEVEIALFRIAQEACVNAVVHGRARRAWIDLLHADGEVVLTISDDGVGFDPAAAAGKGLGLGTMRERAEAVGGSLEISSRPGRTRVRVRVPLESHQDTARGE